MLLAVLLLTLLAAGFFRWFDRVPYQDYVGYRGAARINTLLAAQRFLARTGARARGFASLQGLPPTAATLVLPTPRVSLSSTRHRELLDWVRAGGYLIVVSWTLKGEGGADPLLDPLGIEQVHGNPENGKSCKVSDDDIRLTDVTFRGSSLKVHFDPHYGFKATPAEIAWKVDDEHGIHALSLALGRGRLTALTDADFMTNEGIGLHDHAAFLWHLVRMAGQRAEIWLVHTEDMPSLFELLWQRANPVIIAAALLLAALFFAAMPRFGPVLAAPLLARKRLDEHILASGWFLWRQRHSASLLAAVREAAGARLTGRMGEERKVRLAPSIPVPGESMRRPEDESGVVSEATFTKAVREAIRKRP